MPTYRLHNWTFNLWNGPPPGLITQHVSNHTRAGAFGTDHTKLGMWGDPFTRRLSSYYQSHDLALAGLAVIVNPLIDAGLVRLWYAGIDYLATFQTIYKVTDLRVVECVSAVHVFGSGVNLTNAGILTVDITMVPHPG